MPRRYVKIRDECMGHGGNEKACKVKAAKIFNATRKKGEKPVTGKQKGE